MGIRNTIRVQAAILMAATAAARGQLVTAEWTTAATSVWGNPASWSSNPYSPNNGNPAGVTYLADIAATGTAYTVGLLMNTTVDGLTINSSSATVAQSAATMTPGTILLRAGQYSLTGGTLNNATINIAGGTFTATGGTLDNVTFTGTDPTLPAAAVVDVVHGLTDVAGKINLAGGAQLRLDGSAPTLDHVTLNGVNTSSGKILLNGLPALANNQSSVVTFGPSAVVSGAILLGDSDTTRKNTLVSNGQVFNNPVGVTARNSIQVSTGVFTNHGSVVSRYGIVLVNSPSWSTDGTMTAAEQSTMNLSGGWTNSGAIGVSANGLLLAGGTWSNTGRIDVSATGTFTATGSWTNTGVVNAAAGSVVNFTSNFSTGALGNYTSAGTTNVAAAVNNSGSTLHVTGAWNLGSFSTFTGGTVDASAPGAVFGANSATFDNVTVTGGPLAVNDYGLVTFTPTVVAPAVTLARGSVLQLPGGTRTINNATVAANYASVRLYVPTGQTAGTVTIGSNFSASGLADFTDVSGQSAVVNNGLLNFFPGGPIPTSQDSINAASVVNNSTISAPPGTNLQINSSSFANYGAVSLGANSVLAIGGNWSNAGTITVAPGTAIFSGSTLLYPDGTITLGGNFRAADLQGVSAPVVVITGEMNNSAATFDASKASLQGGVIDGGIVTSTAGGVDLGYGVYNGVKLVGIDVLVQPADQQFTIRNGLTADNHSLYFVNGTVLVDGGGQTLDSLQLISPIGGTKIVINSLNPATGIQGVVTLGPSAVVAGTNISGATTSDTLDNRGLLLANSSSIMTVGTVNLINDGTISVPASGRLRLGKAIVNHGAIRLSGGTLTTTPILHIGDGSLGGSGSIAGPVVLDTSPISTLLMHLAGNQQGTNYDFLSVTGTMTLGGNLAIYLDNGFTPTTDSYTILQSTGTMSGSFLNVIDGGRLLTADGRGSFQVNYNDSLAPKKIVLSQFVSVPEPAGTTAAAVIGLSLGRYRRRDRHR